MDAVNLFQFIVTNIFLISVGTLIYLVVRTLPRIDEHGPAEKKASLLERWMASEVPEKIDETVNTYTGKILRKVKVVLLKVDNVISKRLQKIRPANERHDPIRAEFKKISEDRKANKNSGTT